MYIRIIHGHVRTISLFFPLPIPSTLKPVNASETSSPPFFSTWNAVEKKRIDTFQTEKHLTRQKDTEIKVRSQIVLKYASIYIEQKIIWELPSQVNSSIYSQIPKLDIFQCSWGWAVTILFYENPIFNSLRPPILTICSVTSKVAWWLCKIKDQSQIVVFKQRLFKDHL